MVKNLLEMQETQVWSWRKESLPTPVFLPGGFHGQKSLVGNSLWGHNELDMTEHTRTHPHRHTHTHTHIYIKLSQFGVSQKLTQHCKSTVLQKKKKIRNVRRIKEDYGYIPKRALLGSHTTVCQENVHVLFLLRNNQSKMGGEMWRSSQAIQKPINKEWNPHWHNWI